MHFLYISSVSPLINPVMSFYHYFPNKDLGFILYVKLGLHPYPPPHFFIVMFPVDKKVPGAKWVLHKYLLNERSGEQIELGNINFRMKFS